MDIVFSKVDFREKIDACLVCLSFLSRFLSKEDFWLRGLREETKRNRKKGEDGRKKDRKKERTKETK